ncbi:MAG TPA: glycoside hydrolase family 127 protein [Oscillospiraceae bacterium]|nr:glycoside hydrolase family 127 protein [Oscillospiraceae bacterium]HPF55803.1 glycoside hydrolase family 127 protein [Clostridiales bacterium]HPK35425.1 glycoside hydrolase family 127 protein [Oscillospiraceae bacterium]HPR75149.1 glycoside hydrolase family 127 protein [Oscillospiraceae bacterium]
MQHFQRIPFQKVDIEGGFWGQKQQLNRDVTIRAVRDQFEDTGRFAAFDFDWTEGKPNKPHYFWDSDIAKWIESAAYIIDKNPDPELEAKIEEVIDKIEAHRQPDGYFNIYFTVVDPENKLKVRGWHELYCAGHLFEAAVAYYEATGKDRFLNLMRDYADFIYDTFAVKRAAAFLTPGHEEIELALIKLWKATGEQKYLDLSAFFIDNHGTPEDELDGWAMYCQCHLPVREQKTAEGHSVRACYLYSGMADNAWARNDKALFEACEMLFKNITERRMYITGGIGSSNNGEAFTIDWDLPNKTAYAETCAAISLAMFANRMLNLEADSRYADTVERVMYNGFLAGLSLDGEKFFYTNPLKITLWDRGRHTSMPKDPDYLPITERVRVFKCSCCPPNVTRFIAALGEYFYTVSENTLFVHQYAGSTAEFELGGRPVTVTQSTKYPADGKIEIRVTGAKGKKLAVRLPGWCANPVIGETNTIINGYAYIEVTTDDFTVELDFPMIPVAYEANTHITEDSGRIAIMRGPVVFCAEAVDNGDYLDNVRVKLPLETEVGFDEALGVQTLTVSGLREYDNSPMLYRPFSGNTQPSKLKLIPYYAFANRGPSEMAVWLRR